MKIVFFIAIASLFMIPSYANALEISVSGTGKSVITSDVTTVQALAKNEALQNAIFIAVERTIGADNTLQKNVSRKMDSIISQLEVYKISDDYRSHREGNTYVMTATLKIDDKKFRKLVSDMGIAINTVKSRAAGAMLVIVDEYYTTPTFMNAPLRDLTEFSTESTQSHKEMEAASASHKAASGATSSYRGAAGVSARNGYGGSYSGAAAVRGKSSRASMEQGKASYARGESDFAHTRVNFKRLIEYQPKNTSPDKRNDTIGAFKRQLQESDLTVISNDLFRSKYFKRPITIESLQNSEHLSKYATYARKDAKADYLTIGTSVIVDNGTDSSTGLFTCDGMVTVSTYATEGGEDIASDAVTESAQGSSTDQCRTNVAIKMGERIGSVIATNVQEYWKKRSMYGREYYVVLQGSVPLATRLAFSKALKSTQGIDGNVEQRSSNGSETEFVATYKGSAPVLEAIAENLVTIPAFSNIDAITEGNRIFFCPGKCQQASLDSPAIPAKKAKKGRK